ncbi:response regulator [Ferrovum sp.]|uniref:response regulator n=1 Tax=Ferrovum sp. TaxID=2609467 RepID=UPI00261CA9FA|nr:response regulator [Ferrovum sp.]
MISPTDILHGKVLIVDDLEANTLLLERMLRGAGYVAITSTMNPGEVCALHLKNHYDLILLDLQMPGMDGFHVMEELRAIEPDGYLPVLVITAQPDHKLRALKAGAKDFISKPFDLADVLARVNNMLEVRLLHVEAKNYSKTLEQKIQEVEASRALIHRQSDEVRRLYDEIVAEQKRSIELSLQPGAMVGVEKEERTATRWVRSLRLRHPWLQINLLTAFAAAAVVGHFQETISRLLILTMFLPVLADQACNTGSQALAITLRGIALGDLESGKEKALVRKEALLGLLNGALVGLVAATGMYGVATVQHLHSAPMLSSVVFLAMIGSCFVSGICGAVVPLILKRLGADPATASSIFLTTATNIVSMGMLLGLATVLVKR